MNRTASANLLAAFVATSFRDPMLSLAPLDRVVQAVYVKRVIDVFDATEPNGPEHRYYFMVYRITVDGDEREYSIETRLENVISNEELKHAAQGFVASYGREP